MMAKKVHRLEKEIPYGYRRKTCGRIVEGDMVWMPIPRAFREPRDLEFSVWVRDYYFVIEMKEVIMPTFKWIGYQPSTPFKATAKKPPRNP